MPNSIQFPFNVSGFLFCFFGILGIKYQSNLNEIDKSEQKSQSADSSNKVHEWPSKDESFTESK